MKILETCLYAEDLEECRQFYEELLGIPQISYDESRHLFLRLDHSVLIVFKASKTRLPDAGVPPHGTEGAGHAAFAASLEEIVSWRRRLADAGVPIIQEVEWGPGVRSIYFQDPAGNVLEFAVPKLWFRE